MKEYFIGWTSQVELRKVGKAIWFTHGTGRHNGDGERVFFPVSQCIFGETNKHGNTDIMIPSWLFRSKNIVPNDLNDFVAYVDNGGQYVKVKQ